MTQLTQKMVEHSDGALTEMTVLDSLVSDHLNGENVDLDDMLDLNKKAMDHLRSLRVNLQKAFK